MRCAISASSCRSQRRYGEAVAVYDRALAVDPRLPEALNNRGTALRGLNRPAAAIMSFDRALGDPAGLSRRRISTGPPS